MVVNMNLQSKDRNDISKTVWNQALSAFIAISLVFGQSHLEAKAAPPQTKVAPVQANNVAAEEKNSKIEEKVELFAEILKDIQNLYVEPVDLDKLTETGFNAMLSSLDPYTEFENVQAAQQMKVQTFGNYGGVGLVIAKPKNSKVNMKVVVLSDSSLGRGTPVHQHHGCIRGLRVRCWAEGRRCAVEREWQGRQRPSCGQSERIAQRRSRH